MTDKELRELDAFIAEHGMGWKWFRLARDNKHWCQLIAPSENWHKRTCFNYCELTECDTRLEDWTDLSIFKPTTDPAASMAVLKKCADKSPQVIISYFGGICRWVVSGPSLAEPIKAETLELAICLFAKALFGGTPPVSTP